MKLRRSKQNALSMLTVASMLTSMPGYATPLPSEDFHLDGPTAQEIARHPILKNSKFFKDHASNVLYVGPASQKVQAGNFEVIAPLECSRYQSLYELTYKLPATNQAARDMAERLESTGPYFDMLFANYYIFNDLIRRALVAALSIQDWQDDHRDEIAAIAILAARIDNIEAQVTPLEEQIEALEQERRVAQLEIFNHDPGTPSYDEALAAYQQVNDRVRTEIRDINSQIASLNRDLLPLQLERDIKQADLDATKPLDYDDALELASRARRVMADLNADATRAHGTLVSALNAVESKTVGYANAWYTVWDNEQSALQGILSRHGSRYNAQRLPIFNVSFLKNHLDDQSSSQVKDPDNVSAVGTESLVSNVSNFGIRMTESSHRFPPQAFATMKDRRTGAAVDIGVRERNPSEDRFGFKTLVTQGVYCSGKNQRSTGVLNWTLKDGFKTTIVHTLLPSRRTTPVLAQDVKAQYSYYQKTDPIAVLCQLHVSKFESFARDVGSNRFLFWGKKWDKAERDRINNNGLSCKIDVNAQSGVPQVDEAKAQEIYQSLMQDLAADYILNFASDYDVMATEPTGSILTENGQYSKKVGPAMMTLCGGNYYCQIANVVFLALDQLIDARSGEVERVDTQNGTMTRYYSQRSYTTVKDESLITVEVRL